MNPAPAPTSKHILVVDDDGDLRAQISDYLARHGFEVAGARDGQELARALAEAPVDLIILDVMLPGEDGLSICRRLTGEDAPPIIMLSAMGEEADRVIGLEIGADDYLPKPCSPRELLARVRAVLRRRSGAAEGAAPGARLQGSTILFDGFRLDLVRRKLNAPNGSVIVLSNNEMALLAALLQRAGEAVSREELAQMAEIGDPAGVDRAVDMQISRLRRKLHAEAPAEIIQTVRGRGYRLIAVDFGGAPAPQSP